MGTNQLLEVPSPDNFVRRAWHSSVALNEHIYIHGGEISQNINYSSVTAPQNTTLMIDMSKSWTNESVTFRSIESVGPPNLNSEILFSTQDDNSFFIFGGSSTQLWGTPKPPLEHQLWEFSESTDSWKRVHPGSAFLSLTRPTWALGAMLGDTGYVLGGVENSYSNPALELENVDLIPGIVSFNMSAQIWENTTSPNMPRNVSFTTRPHTPSNNMVMWLSQQNRLLASLPSFGPVGLLLAAGTEPSLEASNTFDNITLYEPIKNAWYFQKATGEVPLGRLATCTVGVQGDNGTYEM